MGCHILCASIGKTLCKLYFCLHVCFWFIWTVLCSAFMSGCLNSFSFISTPDRYEFETENHHPKQSSNEKWYHEEYNVRYGGICLIKISTFFTSCDAKNKFVSCDVSRLFSPSSWRTFFVWLNWAESQSSLHRYWHYHVNRNGFFLKSGNWECARFSTISPTFIESVLSSCVDEEGPGSLAFSFCGTSSAFLFSSSASWSSSASVQSLPTLKVLASTFI